MRLLVLALLIACGRTEPAPDPNIHTITLAPDEPPLPEAPGSAEVNDSCRVCHSSRYLTSQPKLPRKTWTAEVEKMRTIYGASVPDAAAPKIVDYLVQVNGTE